MKYQGTVLRSGIKKKIDQDQDFVSLNIGVVLTNSVLGFGIITICLDLVLRYS